MAAALLASSLIACSALPGPGSNTAASEPPRDLRVGTVLMAEGLKKLQDNRYEDASRIFNAGLKFSPDNARLHFLNGLAYHLLYLRGDETMLELAVAGYDLALAADPAFYDAALQLGRLQFDARLFEPSVTAFRRASEIEPTSGEAFLGMATAAYYAHDLETAGAAINAAAPLLKDKQSALRAAALIRAALGDDAGARDDLRRYAAMEADKPGPGQLARRLDQWKLWHANHQEAGPDTRRTLRRQVMAQISAPASQAPMGTPSGPRQPAVPAWFDCGAGTAPVPPPMTGGAAPGGDETALLAALPVPCKDAGLPHMVVLDVVIVRTEDNSSSSQGINLLTGLTYVFNRSMQLTDTITRVNGLETGRNVTITRQRSHGLPTPAGVAYSLNIANSVDSRSYILARPSLVALDRQPSTFFSGRVLSVGLSGTAGGTSTLVDKPIGVSLSVTPTFVDAESILVSVRAARSFFEPIDASGTFVQAVQTSRNSVTANVALKFGQTLILSGLTEQEVERASNGVPVLQDIPVLQYLFRNKTIQNFSRSVLLMVTPRKPVDDRDATSRTVSELEVFKSGERKDLIPKILSKTDKDQGASVNVESAYRHSFHNELFLQFRSGDIRADDWSQPPRLELFFRKLGDLLYY